MASSVFFRFKSQKEPSRVTFDGTGISVFELKREIISINRLGDGTDFELVLCAEDSKEEYDDDTFIIPRSTAVIAKRLPAIRSGKGGAARYVSGKMPQNAKNLHRQDLPLSKPSASAPLNQSVTASSDQTEEEKIKAMFQIGANQWAQEQQAMASAIPIHRGGPMKGKPQSIPDHDPPPGYICYRCGEKGHWIMSCPTNNDPTYDGKPRVKRTTGIPRSFLKIVDKPSSAANDGTIDETKQPSGIMVNAEGDWVVAEPDKATWDSIQAKAKVSAAAQSASYPIISDSKDHELECKFDKRLFVNPMKTPCCQKTFCHDCITNALLDHDLRCPECLTDDVPIEDLSPDVEAIERIRQYEAATSTKTSSQGLDQDAFDNDVSESKQPPREKEESTLQTNQGTDRSCKKRSADSDLLSDRKPASGPKASFTENKGSQSSFGEPNPMKKDESMPYNQDFFNHSTYGSCIMPDLSTTGFPHVHPNCDSRRIAISPSMSAIGPNNAMPNSLIVPNGAFMNNDWSGPWGGGQFHQGMSIGPNPSLNSIDPNVNYNQQNNYSQAYVDFSNGVPVDNFRGNPPGQTGTFANQQRTSLCIQSSDADEGAYFRKPVNPYRHQGRRNTNRPMDYREV